MFSYIFSLDNLIVPIIALVMVFLYGLSYFFLPYLYQHILYTRARREKTEKQEVIKDLILMKEIQAEIEKELEQSLLNVALNKGT